MIIGKIIKVTYYSMRDRPKPTYHTKQWRKKCYSENHSFRHGGWHFDWSREASHDLSLSLSLIINKKVSTTKIVNFLTPGTARNCQFHDSGAGVERFKLSGVDSEILVVCGGGWIFFRGMGSGAPVGPNPRKLLNFSDFNTIISSYRWSYTPLIYMQKCTFIDTP